MVKSIEIEPYKDELPTDYADRVGLHYTSTVSANHKKKNGQFFTPTQIARFMGDLAITINQKIKILDPGCGTAILACGLIESLTYRSEQINEIELTVYEIDNDILPFTKITLEYLQRWLEKKKIKFRNNLISKDFILENSDVFNEDSVLSLFDQKKIYKFDYVISNPPYFKLSKNDTRAKVSEKIVNGQPNIYALFMAIAAKLLDKNGQFIFITPRSFASGNYFRTFREFFFKAIQIEQIHLFVSRKDTFNRDNVLQETVIMKGKKIEENGIQPNILVSSSFGLNDLNSPKIRIFKQSELIDFDSIEKIIHLPTTDFEENVISLFKSWNNTLKDYDIKISTGPVVAFRATEFIKEKYQNGIVFLSPLYWLHNVNKMLLEWPVHKSGKGQYIQICKESQSLLIPNKNYVLLRRFSAKDDKSRLVAAPYIASPKESEFIGVENKVNYIYKVKGHLEHSEVMGLAALLNSKLFDTYFRTFNGNVNVSATELREMPMPPMEIIKEIGNQIIVNNDISQSRIDSIVYQFFEISSILSV